MKIADGTFSSEASGKKLPLPLLVEPKNGTQEWVKLKDLRESNPIELAQCTKQHGLINEPAFAWWVCSTPYLLTLVTT